MDERDFSSILSKKCKRKEIRKTGKKIKVISRVAFSKHQKLETAIAAQFNNKKSKKREKRKRQAERKRLELLAKEDEPQDLQEFLKEAAEVRKQRLLDEMDDDDLEIEKLERKISKRAGNKSKERSGLDEEDEVESYIDEFADEDGLDLSDQESLLEAEELSNGEIEMLSAEELIPSDDEDKLESPDEDDAMNEIKHSVDAGARHNLSFDPALVKLSNRAKMESKVRRNVFCTIMSSTEADNAFNQLQALKLNGPEEREIIRVCVDCVMLETEYNSYYALIVKKFCVFNRQFQVTAQYALWDTIKELLSLKKHQQRNLACMVADLFRVQAVGLSVLRIINFADLSLSMTEFLRNIFNIFLLRARDSVIRDAFLSVINSAKKKNVFSEGLQSYFEQPVSDLLLVVEKGEDKQKNAENVELFKKRLAMIKMLWSII